MDSIFSSSVRETIAAFRRISAPLSISPDSLGAILDAICRVVDSVAAAAADRDAVELLQANVASLKKTVAVIDPPGTPGHCPTLSASGRLPASVLPAAGQVAAAFLPWLWSLMTDDGMKSVPFLFAEDVPQVAIVNGYYPELNQARPYFMNGAFFSLQQAAQILFDKWSIGSGGVMLDARANLPQTLKETDSRITMAYTATNNGIPYIISLGRRGVRSMVTPVSIYRAFHGAGDLRAVIGIINLERISEPFEIQNAFINCPNLRFFLIKHIPECVSVLDLSGCSPDIVTALRFDDPESMQSAVAFSPLKFLLENIDNPDLPEGDFVRDPDAPLLIRLPAAAVPRFRASAELMAAYRAARLRHDKLSIEGVSL